MNRRRFLWRAGFTIVVLIGGGASLFVNRLFCRKVDPYSELPEALQALYRQDFAKAFPDLTLEEINAKLQDLGVYIQTESAINQIHRNAVHDPLVEFDNFLWTKSELFLYAVVARLHAKGE